MNIRIGTPCARHCPGDVAAVSVGRHPGKVEVGPIDRKIRNNLPDRALEQSAREIRGHWTFAGQLRRAATECVELARHFIFHDP